MKYRIEDWTGRVMDTFAMTVHCKVAMDIPPQIFNSFEDAEDFLCVVLDDKYEEERQEYYIEECESHESPH